jgi:putative protease
MTGRDANRGKCSHPCRWKYAVVEETRPGQYFPIEQDHRGTYLLSSRDLCMIEHLPAMIGAGIDSLKIEGRMKGINYVASVVKVYREALDRYYDDPDAYRVEEDWLRELDFISHRPYGTGFYFGAPEPPLPGEDQAADETPQRLIGIVLSSVGASRIRLDVRNKFFSGEEVEILPRKGPAGLDKIIELSDEAGRPIPFAQPNTRVIVTFQGTYGKNDIVRRPIPVGLNE